MPSPDDAPKQPIPDWFKELLTPKAKCSLHNEPQPCIVCALSPKIPTPKESPGTIPIGYPIDDENGDQHGVE
jgi:hypothetical protein